VRLVADDRQAPAEPVTPQALGGSKPASTGPDNNDPIHDGALEQPDRTGRASVGGVPGVRLFTDAGGVIQHHDQALLVLVEQIRPGNNALTTTDAPVPIDNNPHGSSKLD
jgi:hypothetical protein